MAFPNVLCVIYLVFVSLSSTHGSPPQPFSPVFPSQQLCPIVPYVLQSSCSLCSHSGPPFFSLILSVTACCVLTSKYSKLASAQKKT